MYALVYNACKSNFFYISFIIMHGVELANKFVYTTLYSIKVAQSLSSFVYVLISYFEICIYLFVFLINFIESN